MIPRSWRSNLDGRYLQDPFHAFTISPAYIWIQPFYRTPRVKVFSLLKNKTSKQQYKFTACVFKLKTLKQDSDRAKKKASEKTVCKGFSTFMWRLFSIETKCAVIREGILRHQFDKETRVFCSMQFTVHSTSGFYRKPYMVLKIHTKKFVKQENSSLFMKNFL